MTDNSCPYHTDHNSRIKKLEQNYDDLDDRVTNLDKEFAVNRAEISGALKNLERLPETMTQISNTMVTIQNEIKSSNTIIEGRIKGVELKIDSNLTGVDDKIKNINSQMSDLDKRVVSINESDTINIRKGFRNWFLKNWMYIGFGGLLALTYLSSIIKGLVSQ